MFALIAGWCICAIAQPASAEGDNDYAVTVPGVVRTPEDLQAAYAEALRRVLVTVTGGETAGRDPALLARFGNPTAYIERYKSDRQRTYVQFDAEQVRRVLVASGYLAAPAENAGAQGSGAMAVRLVVTNIHSPDDYGAVVQIFRSLQRVGGMAILGAYADTVTIAISARRGPDEVRQAISESSTLQVQSSDDTQASGDVLRYRYAPTL